MAVVESLPSMLIERVLACFEPSEFSVAAHADVAGKLLEQTCSLELKGYYLCEKSTKGFGMAGSIIYQKFVWTSACGSPKSVIPSCLK